MRGFFVWGVYRVLEGVIFVLFWFFCLSFFWLFQCRYVLLCLVDLCFLKMNFQTIIHILVPKHCFLPLSKQVHHVSVMQDENFYLLEDQVDQVSHCHPSDQQDPREQ